MRPKTPWWVWSLAILVVLGAGIGTYYFLSMQEAKVAKTRARVDRLPASEIQPQQWNFIIGQHTRVKSVLTSFLSGPDRTRFVNFGVVGEDISGGGWSFELNIDLGQYIVEGFEWFVGLFSEDEEKKDAAVAALEAIDNSGRLFFPAAYLKYGSQSIDLLIVQYIFDRVADQDEETLKNRLFVLFSEQDFDDYSFQSGGDVTFTGYVLLRFQIEDAIGIPGVIPGSIFGTFEGEGSNLYAGDIRSSKLFLPNNLAHPLSNLANLDKQYVAIWGMLFDSGSNAVLKLWDPANPDSAYRAGNRSEMYGFQSSMLQNNFGEEVNSGCNYSTNIGSLIPRTNYVYAQYFNRFVCMEEDAFDEALQQKARGLSAIFPQSVAARALGAEIVKRTLEQDGAVNLSADWPIEFSQWVEQASAPPEDEVPPIGPSEREDDLDACLEDEEETCGFEEEELDLPFSPPGS